MKERKFTLL